MSRWPNTHYDDSLHLAASMRSFRAEHVSAFVKALLDCKQAEARAAYSRLGGRYPIVLTRGLGQAKEWIRSHARGTERYGLVASSKAQRLKPHAIDIRATCASPVPAGRTMTSEATAGATSTTRRTASICATLTGCCSPAPGREWSSLCRRAISAIQRGILGSTTRRSTISKKPGFRCWFEDRGARTSLHQQKGGPTLARPT